MSRRSERIRSREPTSTPPPPFLPTQPEDLSYIDEEIDVTQGDLDRTYMVEDTDGGLEGETEDSDNDGVKRKGKGKGKEKEKPNKKGGGTQSEQNPAQVKCPVCLKNAPKKFTQHLLLSHPDHHYTPQELAGTDIQACGCGKPVRGRRGLTQHRNTSGCTERIVDPRLGVIGSFEAATQRKAPATSRNIAPSSSAPTRPAAAPPSSTSASTVQPRGRTNAPISAPILASAGNWMSRNNQARRTSQSPASRLLSEVDAEARQHRFLSLSCLPTTYKRLHNTVATAFKNKVGELAATFNAEPSSEALFHILSLPKVGLAAGLKVGRREAIRSIGEFPAVRWPKPHSTARVSRPRSEVAIRHLETGRVGQAARALEDSCQIAPVSEETIEALRAKHPEGPASPFATPGSRHDTFPITPDNDSILPLLDTFRPDTAPGISGWTVPLLKLASGNTEFRIFMEILTGLIANGTAPGKDMLRVSRLTPLLKPKGGIRPIAVGEMMYRLAAKAILRKTLEKDTLLPQQLGVGSKGGVEPAVHCLLQAMEGKLGVRYTHGALLDSENAFNSADRDLLATALRQYSPGVLPAAEWMYGTPSDLVVRKDDKYITIPSSQGVRQGDPLGPYFYSVVVRPFLEQLMEYLGPEYLVIAYLDDIIILGPDDNIINRVVEFLKQGRQPIRLNENKSKVFSLKEVEENGLRLLGTCVGAEKTRAEFLEEKIEEQEAILARLSEVPHQHALSLLRSSIQQNLRHLMRSLPSHDLSHIWQRLDNILQRAVLRLRGSRSSTPEREELTQALIGLPARLGGLGIQSFKDCSNLAFNASWASSAAVLRSFIPEIVLPDDKRTQKERCVEMHESQQSKMLEAITPFERTLVVESASNLGRRWLSVLPTGPTLHLSDHDISVALHRRLLTYRKTTYCSRCKANADSPSDFIAHDDHCKSQYSIWTQRHNRVQRLWFKTLETVEGLKVTKEPQIPGTDRCNDIRLEGGRFIGTAIQDYDLQITALSTKEAVTVAGQKPREGHASDKLVDQARGRAQALLKRKVGDKLSNLPVATGDPIPTLPLLLTSGGLLEDKTEIELRKWKRMIGNGEFDFMMRRMAVVLVKARAESFQY